MCLLGGLLGFISDSDFVKTCREGTCLPWHSEQGLCGEAEAQSLSQACEGDTGLAVRVFHRLQGCLGQNLLLLM